MGCAKSASTQVLRVAAEPFYTKTWPSRASSQYYITVIFRYSQVYFKSNVRLFRHRRRVKCKEEIYANFDNVAARIPRGIKVYMALTLANKMKVSLYNIHIYKYFVCIDIRYTYLTLRYFNTIVRIYTRGGAAPQSSD